MGVSLIATPNSAPSHRLFSPLPLSTAINNAHLPSLTSILLVVVANKE